jgi:hypothetical protein
MGHAGALISGGADTADAKLAIMEECGFKVTRNPSEMAKLLKAVAVSKTTQRRGATVPPLHCDLHKKSGKALAGPVVGRLLHS